MIERKGRSWWTWQWTTPYYTHVISTRNIFKKSAGQHIDSDDDDPFFSRTKAHGGGVKSRKGIRVTLKNNLTSSITCLHTQHSEATSTLSSIRGIPYLEFRYTQPMMLPSKRIDLSWRITVKPIKQSSVHMMRFDTGRITIWSTATRTLHLTCMLQRLTISESQPRRDPNSITHTETFTSYQKEHLHLR